LIKIVFFATPEIAVPSLNFLAQCSDIECCAVVTKVDKPQGRGQKIVAPPVKIAATANNIQVFQPRLIRTDCDVINKLKEIRPDFFVTFAYGQILSSEILDIPKFGTVNLHASLLPQYRGANPIQCAIVNGECKTGITTMLTVEELDAGDICRCKEIEISENMNDAELSNLIAKLSPDLLYDTLKSLYGKKLCPVKQNSSEATFTCKFEKQDGCINWTESAKTIHNKIRGLYTRPCCFTYFDKKMIKITGSLLSEKKTTETGGTFLGKSKDGLDFATGDGVITITKVKPEGKKEMNAKDWLNGAKLNAGDKFTCQSQGE